LLCPRRQVRTLFPYTTLFRSPPAGTGLHGLRGARAPPGVGPRTRGERCARQAARSYAGANWTVRSPPEASWCARACAGWSAVTRSEEHTSELQSREKLVCRLL